MFGAILSCYDKRGLAEFAAGLRGAGLHLLASSGSFQELTRAGVDAESIESFTAQWNGCHSKTLQAKLHEGIFCNPEKDAELELLTAHGGMPMRVVCCNMYPLEQALHGGFVQSMDDLYGLLDIGGGALLANAAKNHRHVYCVSDPADYPVVLRSLLSNRPEDGTLRAELAQKAFHTLSMYHAAAAHALEHIGMMPWVSREGKLPC